MFAQSNLPNCEDLLTNASFNCYGTFTTFLGNTYVGEFKDGKFHGQGTNNHADGKKYVGEYKNGKANGLGTLYASNGSVTKQGIWADGNFVRSAPVHQASAVNQTVATATQQPNISQSNSPACQGSDVSRWSNCVGTEIFPSGDKYTGEFKSGRFSGRGVYYYLAPNQNKGKTFVGEFKDGMYNGLGIEYDRNGVVLNSGKWKNSQIEDLFAINSNLFSISTVTSTGPEERAPIVAADQSNLPICQGSDQRKWNSCIGIVNYRSSVLQKFVGVFLNGERNGVGIEYANDGSVFSSGTWKGAFNLIASHPVDTQRFPFNSSVSTVVSQTPITDLVKAERDRLAADLEASKRKQHELEEQLSTAQLAATQNIRPVQNISTERRVALVVGNANYKVRPLKNSRNDADDVSRSLKTTGFEVIDLRDATLPQMRTAVRQFGDRLINNDVGLVYYSGHGVEVKGRNYFIPVNADIQREDEIADQGLDVSLILEKMSTAGKGVNILIVDACRDDPFGRSFRSSSRGLANMDAPRGTIIAYATSPGKVASDGDPRERNSPYTKHLVKAMQSPNKPIEQVFKEVRRSVQDETKNQQTPWENTSLSGDFFFRVQR